MVVIQDLFEPGSVDCLDAGHFELDPVVCRDEVRHFSAEDALQPFTIVRQNTSI
jgi:hypothetical protein